MDPLNRLRPKVKLILEVDGREVVTEELINLLRGVRLYGSLLAASKAAGMPYSNAWELVAKAERVLGVKLIEARRGGRGGGGARLTAEGERLVEVYMSYMEKTGLKARPLEPRAARPDLVIAGSHDPLLELIAGDVRRAGYSVEVSWIGSSGGLASLMLGEADVAGTHLYDPSTDSYNLPFLQRFWIRDRVMLVRGYMREIVLAYHPGIELNSVGDLLTGRYRIINRNLGSGTRVLLDYLLGEEARRRGLDPQRVRYLVPGYEREVRTHTEVARAIANGEADAGLVLRWEAEHYGLKWLHVRWEWYDLAVLVSSSRKRAVRALLAAVVASVSKARLPGYRFTEDTGRVIYAP